MKLASLLTTNSLDPIIIMIAVLAIFVILISLLLRKFKQTYIIGYIFVGILLGEHGFSVVKDSQSVYLLGEIGVILLLFFIGMEINLIDFIKRWKVAVVGTLSQIILSVLIVFLIGNYLNWSVARSVVLGFVIALSSSAVVIKLLQDKKLIETRVGKNVLSILLAQDIALVPLLIIIAQLGGQTQETSQIILMSVGAILIVGTLIYIYIKKSISFPFANKIERDHELQVFMAIFFCFGGALITMFFGLSAALGAFVGGIIMNAAREADWIHHTLHSFRVLFVSFFFIGIGLQIDLNFIYTNIWSLTTAVLVVFLTNQFVNALVLKLFDCNYREAFLGGAYLAQIGELSFLLSSTALALGIIGNFGYNFTISLISLTLIISPFWIVAIEKLIAVMDYDSLPLKKAISRFRLFYRQRKKLP